MKWNRDTKLSRTLSLVILPACLLLLPDCTTHSQRQIQTVKAFRAARERGDDAQAAQYLTADSRMWFYQKSGPGFLVGHGGELWRHWDIYFHGHTTLADWKAQGNAVSAIGHEDNDFYDLLDWHEPPFRNTWWFDKAGKIKEILLEPLSKDKAKSRMSEFELWAQRKHPEELHYLMPNGEIDPSADRPERWKKILIEWRQDVGLPPAVRGRSGAS